MHEPYVKEGFGEPEFVGQTTVHPVGAAALLTLCCAMLILPRRYAVIPMLIMAALIPSAQRIVLFSLDFNYLRLLVLVGWARLLMNQEYRDMRWRTMDTVFVLWCAVGFTAPLLRVGPSVLVYECGVLFDALGMYFLFRCLIRSWNDVANLATACAVISVPLAAAFLVEHHTQRNLFAVFGGVREITAIREGRLRCMGPYAHPILAGCFWAVLMPLCAARWWAAGRARLEAVIGSVCALIIVYCCASSTPVLGLAAAAVGAVAFILRREMRLVRWGVLAGLIGLHMVMNAPVWHLISRVSAVGGSTAYHRYSLIDAAIRHFPEWALLGTSSTAHWGWYLFDVTNYYIAQGVTGGVLKLGLFLAFMAMAFDGVGRLWRSAEKKSDRVALSWALGVSMLVHATCFIGVSYFREIIVLWFLVPAIICSLDERLTSRPAVRSGTAVSKVAHAKPATALP